MPTVNTAHSSLAHLAPGTAAAPREAPSRLHRAATFARLAACDAAAILGATAALLPLLLLRRPLGRAPEGGASAAIRAAEGRVLPR